jgi:hypothetical protein
VEGAVYLLCAATALACAVLLLRGFGRTRVRLLLWCGLCFLCMAAENVVLFVDLTLLPEKDLSAFHVSTAVIGVTLLLYGLVWEVK